MATPTVDQLPALKITDPGVMRALAHPARLMLMERLMSGEPATATECAEVCGLSPSATSYHLRALAKVGLIEQAPGRGDGRERLWRSPFAGYVTEGAADATPNPEARAAERGLIEAVLIRQEAQLRQWLATSGELSQEWYRASAFTEMRLVITPDELLALVQSIRDLAEPYNRRTRTDPPADARPVSLVARGLPV